MAETDADLDALDWPGVLEALASRTRTAPGRAAAEAMAPLSGPARARDAFDAVDELRGLAEAGAT